ncbi:MAG: hypothetical protein V4584_13970 [Verrucomicrobiota bacterium]
MNQSLLSILIGCGTLLPLAKLEAAPGKTYGGFAPGKTFTFTVDEKKSYKTKGVKLTKNAPVTDGVPDFAEGESVKFTIGKKGQLKGPGFSITHRTSEEGENFYSNNPSASSSKGDAARVEKTPKGRPTEATLTFYRISFSGFIPVTNTVTYKLE